MSYYTPGESQDSINCDCPETSKPGQSSKSIADSSDSEKIYETENLEILEKFKKIYENRIDEIDKNISIPEFERVSIKLKIMTEWVEDLNAQNIMLVRTAEDLEKAAVDRVKLLEDKLLQSFNLVSDNIEQCRNSGEALNTLSDRISELEGDDYLEKKIECLQSDIRGLLELIRRAHENNCWSGDGITFLEIKPENIPVPLVCTCDEEKGGALNQEYNHILKTMQDKEKALLEKLAMLEQQVSKQNKIILQKEEAYKTFKSKVQTLRDSLKEKSVNCTIPDSSANLDFDIMQVADVLESAFVAKDLDIKNLHQRLEESNSKLEKLLHENEKFEEKNKRIQELEIQLAALQKESMESKEALASEVAEKYDQVIALRKEVQTLEEQCHHLSVQTQFKDDIIKKMRQDLKQITQKDNPHSRHVRINAEPLEVPTEDSSSHENEIMIYLSKTKQLMEKEKKAFSLLKEEIEKVTNELHRKEKQKVREDFPVVYEKLQDMEILLKNYRTQVIESNGSVEEMKSCFTDIEKNMESLQTFLYNLSQNSEENSQSSTEEIIQRLCKISEKISEICLEKQETFKNLAVKDEEKTSDNTCQEQNHELVIKTFLQHLKRMEEFRICTVEAQAATEDLREEMETVVDNFTSRHEKYCELNKLITEARNYLTTTEEEVLKTMSQLKLQEEERKRYNERIATGTDKLKDMKDEINVARMQFSLYITRMQENNQELGNLDFTEIYTSNGALNIVADEVEQIVSNLKAVKENDHCTVLKLSELDTQLSTLENNLQKLFNRSQEVVEANEANQKIFEEREKCINKSEKELDYAHTNMQETLETIFSAMDQINELDVVDDKHLVNEDINETIKIKDEYHKLKKEYESLKMKMIEDSYKKEVDESVNECKCQISNLSDQVRLLKNELKIGEDANSILKNNIQALEKELNGAFKKSDDNKRSYSNENMQLNRKISDLESTLKKQKEIESNLRRTLASSEIELKKSKEKLNLYQINPEGVSSTLGAQVKFEGIPPSLKILQDTIRQTRRGLVDFENKLKSLASEEFTDSCLSKSSIEVAINMLGAHETNIEHCFAEMEKLKNALHSKDQLLEDKEKIITIQKDSISMTQKELKDLHEKLQEKIDTQNNAIAQMDKENKQLQNKIELQVQTIGHLQNAVVQTKRCLDQMGQKFVSDNEKKNEAIRTLNIFLNETQHQYSECFAEAAKQDSLLELQRDSIESLQQKIICKEYNELCKIILLQYIYSANIYHLQEKLKHDCKTFKSQVESLKKTNKSLEEKYLTAKYLWKNADAELKKQNRTFSTKIVECKIGDEEMQTLQSKYNDLNEKHQDLKIELQKCNIDFEFIEQELKKQNERCLFIPNLQAELTRINDEAEKFKVESETENENLKVQVEKYKNQIEMIKEELKTKSTECIPKLETELEKLKIENEDLTTELEDKIKQNEDLITKLNLWKERDDEKLLELEANRTEIKIHKEKINCYESIMTDQTQMIEGLKEKLLFKKQEAENNILDLKSSKKMENFLRRLLDKKSDCMAKLQADCEILKNEYSILKMEYGNFDAKAKEEICELRSKNKETELQLEMAEENYQTVAQDFKKSQNHLIETAKRNVELEQSLTNLEKNFYSKVICMENEEIRLRESVKKMKEDLENLREEVSSKKIELQQIQSACNLYSTQLENTQSELQDLKKNNLRLEDVNSCFLKKLQDSREENYKFLMQIKFLEQNNCKFGSEMEDMHNLLIDLKKECKMKNKSLASMTAELSQATASRSELRNESQYVVSCIRDWMEEQNNVVETLNQKLENKQKQLMTLGFEKKALLSKVKEQRRIINAFMQKRRRQRFSSHNSKNISNKNYPTSKIVQIRNESSSSFSLLSKKYIPKRSKNLISGNSWFFPKIEYLTKTLKRKNEIFNEKLGSLSENDLGDENRDCGYQSSTSK